MLTIGLLLLANGFASLEPSACYDQSTGVMNISFDELLDCLGQNRRAVELQQLQCARDVSGQMITIVHPLFDECLNTRNLGPQAIASLEVSCPATLGEQLLSVLRGFDQLPAAP